MGVLRARGRLFSREPMHGSDASFGADAVQAGGGTFVKEVSFDPVGGDLPRERLAAGGGAGWAREADLGACKVSFRRDIAVFGLGSSATDTTNSTHPNTNLSSHIPFSVPATPSLSCRSASLGFLGTPSALVLFRSVPRKGISAFQIGRLTFRIDKLSFRFRKLTECSNILRLSCE